MASVRVCSLFLKAFRRVVNFIRSSEGSFSNASTRTLTVESGGVRAIELKGHPNYSASNLRMPLRHVISFQRGPTRPPAHKETGDVSIKLTAFLTEAKRWWHPQITRRPKAAITQAILKRSG